MVRTRFAPSPTGYLHVGGLRTALYAYLVAKKNKGKFILRIEDTDRERQVPGAVENLLKTLSWAGLEPDEGMLLKAGKVAEKGKFGPYTQSQRLDIYRTHVDKLIDQKKAYFCFCSEERLEEVRQRQQQNKQPSGYDGHCRDLSPDEVKKRLAAGEKHVVRMKMPKEGETIFHDIVRGEVRIKNELVDDQIILKSDGFPTYHLAVVVDDHEMGVTHIIRGEEWLSSVPKHLKLYEYFGWEVPAMAHLPLILNPDKSKLSKRQGDVAVEDYVKKGYLKEALINFVAFLGWNPGGERELFTLDELVKEFSLEKVGKSGAVFNLEKLNWYNKEYIKKLSGKELAELAMPFLEADEVVGKMINDKGYKINDLEKILSLERERVATLAELPEAVKFVFQLPDYPPSLLIWKKSSVEELKKILPALKDLLNTFSVRDWTKEKLEKKIGEWIKENNFQTGSALWPLRVALSGQQNSPGPFEIAEVLGKEESLRRIETATKK